MSYYGPRSGGHNRSNGDRRPNNGGRNNGWNNNRYSLSNRGYDDRRNNNNYGNHNRYQNSNQYSAPRTRDPKQTESPFKPLKSVHPISPEQQEQRKKQKLLKVTAENWTTYTFEDKARSQFWEDSSTIFSMKGLTADEDIGKDWFAKKKEAAKIAWERVNARIIEASDDSEDMDSDDSSAGYHKPYGDLHQSEQQFVGVKPFIDALPYCVYLDQGFHDNDWNWYCPCSKKLQKWRDNFELTDNERCVPKNKNFCQQGIMDHLRKKAEGENTRNFRHLGTQWYLEELYERR